MILLSAGSQWSTIVLIGGHQREMSKWLFNKDYRLDSCFMFYASAIRICRVEQNKKNPTHLEALALVNSNFTIERNFNKSRWFASIFLLFFLHTKYAVSHFIPIWIACSADKPSPKWPGAHPTSLKAHQAFTVQRLIIQNAGRLHALLHLSTCVLSRMVAQFSWIEREEPFTQFPLVRQSTSANNCGWTPSAYVCVCSTYCPLSAFVDEWKIAFPLPTHQNPCAALRWKGFILIRLPVPQNKSPTADSKLRMLASRRIGFITARWTYIAHE